MVVDVDGEELLLDLPHRRGIDFVVDVCQSSRSLGSSLNSWKRARLRINEQRVVVSKVVKKILLAVRRCNALWDHGSRASDPCGSITRPPLASQFDERRGAYTVGGDVQQVEVAPQVVQGTLTPEAPPRDCTAVYHAAHHLLQILEHTAEARVTVAHVEDDHERDHRVGAVERVALEIAVLQAAITSADGRG
eukprot:5452017-Prymnesium_polylepis.3